MPSETRTDLQQIASRTNGAKSHGPTTEEGKAASSQNRLDHGFNSKRIVLPGESQEEFDALLADYLIEHQPETPTERTLVENMVIARWRQQRVWTLETAGLTNQMARPRYFEGEDPATQAFIAFRTLTDESRSLELLNRYEARFERQFRAALTTLLNLRAKRQARPDSDPPPADAPNGPHYWWIDENGNDIVEAARAAETASGSFRNPDNPAENAPITDIADYKNRAPIGNPTP